MQFYIFWTSVCLGLLELSAKTRWQQQKSKAPKAVKQLPAARHH